MRTRKILPRMKTIKVLEFPPPLLQSRKIVLKTLAKEGPLNAYQMAKKTRKTYSLIFNSIKDLEERGMIRLKARQETAKGTVAKIYDLALKGVLTVLREELRDTERWNYHYIRKIIRTYDSLLPLVFGKWRYLDRMSLEEPALYRLKMVADSLKNRVFERGDPTFPGRNMEDKICWFFYFWGYYPILQCDSFPGLVPDPKIWKNVWKEDQDIKAYIVKRFKQEQRKLENRSIFVRKILSFMERS